MAKQVVIVESPAKARTIGKFLGDDFVVESSIGHIRDLPGNADEVPAEWKKKDREAGRLGIDIENDFAPIYVVPPDKKAHIRALKKLVEGAETLYLATDEDREGEAISWHLLEVLKPKNAEVKRLVFHEITKDAIQRALDNPRAINTELVEAQETRRLVDRLYGYVLSPLLWKKVRPRLSAGRVQSVAVRLVVERERERMAFKTANFWDILGKFAPDGGSPFDARLSTLGGKKLATGAHFDPDTGKLKDSAKEVVHLDEAGARALVERLTGQQAAVSSLEAKPITERPSPPFTTSTLQQAAGRRLGFTAKRTMRAAQSLYQNGYITYMRTDSTALSQESLTASRKLIAAKYGEQYLPDQPRVYKTKVKNAQEAHEAIRPAGSEFQDVAALGRDVGSDERRVYELIWQRTVACQMADAKGMRTTLTVDIDDARFAVSGKTITFPGFRLAYAAEKSSKDEKAEALLPDVKVGDLLETKALDPEGHTTKPPARLTEATIVKELEARGIGRPSTYADIIEKIQARDYCFKKGQALVPTITSFAVTDLLDQHMGHLIDYEFTAKMENDLDEISHGRKQRNAYLGAFYHGNGTLGLKTLVDTGVEKIDPREACSVHGFSLGEHDGDVIELRVGRYAAFLANGEKLRVSLPEELAPDELTHEMAVALLEKAAQGDIPLGQDPDTGLDVYKKTGRFGTYIQLGDARDLPEGDKPKTSSLLPNMDPDTLTIEQALALLSLPRILGTVKTPDTDDKPGVDAEVVAQNGRYGPYLKWGKETRSIPPDQDVLTIPLDKAMEILRTPKQRRGQAAAKAIKELGEHPESGANVRVLEGRYGPYVTDGDVNATVPKDMDPATLEMPTAVELLAARAAKAGKKKPKKKAAKKKTAKKKTTKKKTAAKKKTAKKKTTKKKASTKE